MNRLNLYLIPGLGADKRMYTPQLKVLRDAVVLEHLPAVKKESLTDYAQRLAVHINAREPFALVGTSLGGMICLELTRFVKPQKVVLISTVKTRQELPYFIRSMRYLRLHRVLSGNFYKWFNHVMAMRLDSRGDGAIAEIIKAMSRDTPPEFIEWAVDAVIHWQPPHHVDVPVYHLHGTNDRLFPVKRIKNASHVNGGSHVMNMSKSNEVNDWLINVLNR